MSEVRLAGAVGAEHGHELASRDVEAHVVHRCQEDRHGDNHRHSPGQDHRPAAADFVLLLGTGFMLSADFSIMNVALPKLGAGVGLRVSELRWVVSAYALPAAGFTLLFGRIADLFGRRRIFRSGVALLTASSLAGGFATSAGLLLTARTLQGFATAIASPAAIRC